jgi:hypothetical protein
VSAAKKRQAANLLEDMIIVTGVGPGKAAEIKGAIIAKLREPEKPSRKKKAAR